MKTIRICCALLACVVALGCQKHDLDPVTPTFRCAVTKPVVLKVALLGFGPGMRGAMLSGWEATTTINKADFNVKDPPMLDAALGDDVTITINIEAGMKKT